MNGRIREYTREECPICGHRDWCGRREDGLVLCKRPPAPREVAGFVFKGMAKDGTTGMYVEAGRECVRAPSPRFDDQPRRTTPPKPDGDRVDPKWLTEDYGRLVSNVNDDHRAALAKALELPVSALDALAVGWWPDRRWWNPDTQQYEGAPGCWTFPEYDAHDRTIGLGLRWPDGKKGQMTGGRRGLILPKRWRDLPDPVLVVEGPSDVLGGRAVNLSVVGRPSNSAGADLVAQVCRNRRVILLGENDRKPDGRWPGREGAESVARRLETMWKRPVPVAFPPEQQKDLRVWVVERLAGLEGEPDEEGRRALVKDFLDAITPPKVLLLAASARTRRSAKVVVRAFRWDDPIEAGPFFSDKIDVDNAKARERFAAAVVELEPDTNAADIQADLLKLEIPEATPTRRARVPAVAVPTTSAAQQADGVEPAESAANGPSSETGLSPRRPQIQANERQLRDVRADALAALAARNDPPHLFDRSGNIARIALVQNEQKEAVPQIQHLDADALRGELTNAADWLTLHHSKEHGDYLLPDLPPLAVARDILALPRVDLPGLTGIVTCPTFANDGSLIRNDGYHPASGLWLHQTLSDLPTIPESPTSVEIAAAREAILDIFRDFPFADAASRANALALMLLPFVRPMIAGPTPLHASDAPSPATGKDLLVKAGLLPALGHVVGVTTATKDADEWRKKITSALVAAHPAIVWSNIAYRLDSEHLAAVLTDTTWTDRVLGQTRVVTIPNRAVWACTGNNLAFSKELARRVVWIRLDAKIEAPEQRTGFRYPNLLAHIRQQRPALVAAALTLVRAWLAAGRPKGRQVMGSFESYAEILGGILDVAGVEGFLANADELRRQADSETREWRAFLITWWERWHDAWVGVCDLSELLWTPDGKRTDLLPSVVKAPTERGAVTQLGHRLSAKRDCIIAGLRVTVGEKPDRAKRLVYRLLQTSGERPPEVCAESAPKSASLTSAVGEGYDGAQTSADSFGTPSLYVGAYNTRASATREVNSPRALQRIGKESAEVCESAQVLGPQEDASADSRADSSEESAPRLGPTPPRRR